MTDEFAQAHDDYHASKVIVQTPPQPAMAMPSETETPAPTAPEATEKQLLLDPKFAAAAREVYMLFEGEPFDGDDKMAARYGIDAIGEFNYNFAGGLATPTVTGAPGTIEAAALLTSGTQDQAKAFVYLMDRYDQLPNFTLDGTVRMLRGLIADPSVYTGFGTLGAGFVARKTGAVGIKKLLAEIAKRPGTSAAVYTGIEAGAADQLTQGIEKQAGYEIDPVTGAIRTGVSAVVGGLAGGGTIKAGEAIARELAPAVTEGLDLLGQGAEARMAERGPITDRVMSGGDPMDVIDPALAAVGKLARPTKENPVTAVPPTETEPGIIAFHGSGADFDQFSLEKIGTGEGAQAYGYGLYFTDSEDIAQFYRQTVGGGTGIVDFSIGDLDLVRSGEFRDYSPGATPFGRDRRYRRVQDLTAEDYAQASLIEDIFINEGRLYNEIKKPGAGVIYEPKKGDELKDELINIINETLNSKDPTDQPGEVAYLQNIVESVARGDATIKLDTEQYGKTYKVGLAPKPDELMDYDLSLNQQPEKIKKVLQPFYEKYGVANTADVGTLLESVKRTGAIPDDALTEKFVEAGIPGIKYRAAGSRGASIDAADAEMNYVIFDDKMIKILEKYGIVGPVAVTALGATKQSNSEKDTQNEAM
jgi:hypothetical protein